MLSPNLAGQLAFLVIAGPALILFHRKKTSGRPGAPARAFPFPTLGIAVFAAVIVATGVTAYDLRPMPTEPVTLALPDATALPANAVRSAKKDAGPQRLTVLILRESDHAVVGQTSFRSDALPAEIPLPPGVDGKYRISETQNELCLEEKQGSESLNWWTSINLSRVGDQPVPFVSRYAAEPVLEVTRPRATNLWSLITPGTRYRMLILRWPEGRFPLKPVDAATFLREHPPVWPAEHESSYRREPRIDRLPRAWFAAFGPALLIVFLGLPALLTARIRHLRTGLLAGVVVLLLLGVAAERFLAPAVCAPGSYHRFFTAPAPAPADSAR